MRFLITLCVFCLTLQVVGAEDKQPVLIKKLDPNEGRSKVGVVFDIAEVELTVDYSGVPFALKSDRGLPEYVVTALAQWRCSPYKKNGAATAFLTRLRVPVARQLTPLVERNMVPMWAPTDADVSDAIKLGRALTAEKASEWEARLSLHQLNANAQTSLLVYYSEYGPAFAEQARASRSNILAWLIDHDPGNSILGSSFALVNASGADKLSDGPTATKLADMWLEAVKRKPDDDTVLHAVNFLQVIRPEDAMSVLASNYNKKNDSTAWGGAILGLAALGVNSLDLVSGKPLDAADTAFSNSARERLLKAIDTKMLLSALSNLTWAGRALAARQHLPPIYAEFCPKLLLHVKEFYPETAQTCDTTPNSQDEARQALFEYDEKTTQAKLVRKVPPDYPLAAKQARVTGTVKFNTTISKTGEVEETGLTEGPFIFYASSLAAVRQWRYSPTLINGVPVDVSTVITMNYALSY